MEAHVFVITSKFTELCNLVQVRSYFHTLFRTFLNILYYDQKKQSIFKKLSHCYMFRHYLSFSRNLKVAPCKVTQRTVCQFNIHPFCVSTRS